MSNEDILDNLKAGLGEVQLFKKGKLKTTPAKAFLNELQCCSSLSTAKEIKIPSLTRKSKN